MNDKPLEPGAPHPSDVGPLPGLGESALDAYRRRERTGRELIERELYDAIDERGRALAWLVGLGVGPAAVVAVALAVFVEGSLPLAVVFIILGVVALLFRVYRAHQRVRDLVGQLQDPMDGS